VNASANPATRELLPLTDDLDELPGFRWTAMAVSLGNVRQDLVLSDIAPDYGYSDSRGEHTLDEPPVAGPRGPLGRRTVAGLATHEEAGSVSLQNWPHDELHLVFIRSIERKTLRRRREGFECMAGLLRVDVEKQSLTIRFEGPLGGPGRRAPQTGNGCGEGSSGVLRVASAPRVKQSLGRG